MKRRLLMTMMAMVLAFSFTGCGNKKADETTATTEAASEVKDEFIKFVGTDIPKMDTEEAEIMKKFNSYFAEGTAVDTDALLKDLPDNLLEGNGHRRASICPKQMLKQDGQGILYRDLNCAHAKRNDRRYNRCYYQQKDRQPRPFHTWIILSGCLQLALTIRQVFYKLFLCLSMDNYL